MDISREQYIFLILGIVALPFYNIPNKVTLFPFTSFGHCLSFYFFVIGFFVFICQNHRQMQFPKVGWFYFGILLAWETVTSIIGGLTYPFYSQYSIAGLHIVQKFPLLLQFGFGSKPWVYIIASILPYWLETLFFMILAFWLYSMFFNNEEHLIDILLRGTIIWLVAFGIPIGIVEILNILHWSPAHNVLTYITPWFFDVGKNNSEYPLLVLPNQLRLMFLEPSNLGHYGVYVLPLFFFSYMKERRYYLLGLYFIYTLFIFFSQSRTAYVILFVFIGTTLFNLWFCKKWCTEKKAILALVLIPLLSYLSYISINCINLYENNTLDRVNTSNVILQDSVTNIIADENATDKKTIVADNRLFQVYRVYQYIFIDKLKHNLLSVSQRNARTNGSRFLLIDTDFDIGLQFPFFGTGYYMQDMYMYECLKNKREQYKDGSDIYEILKKIEEAPTEKSVNIAKGAFPQVNEYAARFVMQGLVGLIIFCLPYIYFVWKFIKKISQASKWSTDKNIYNDMMICNMLICSLFDFMSNSFGGNYVIILVLILSLIAIYGREKGNVWN